MLTSEDFFDFFVLTALREEFTPLQRHLGTIEELENGFARAHIIDTHGQERSVLLYPSGCGQGIARATNVTTAAILKYRPHVVILTGIAGGFSENEIYLGDLLVPESIDAYELAKRFPGSKTKRRQPALTVTARGMIGEAKTIMRSPQEWYQNIKTERPRSNERYPTIHAVDRGVLGSGDKNLADEDAEERKYLLETHEKRALGFEMEAAGVATACTENTTLFAVIKGVQDDGTFLKDDHKTKDEWRDYAADAAATLTVEIMRKCTTEYIVDELRRLRQGSHSFGAGKVLPALFASYEQIKEDMDILAKTDKKQVAKILVATGDSIFKLMIKYLEEAATVPDMDVFVLLIDHRNRELCEQACPDWQKQSEYYHKSAFPNLNNSFVEYHHGRIRIHCALYNFLPQIQGGCFGNRYLYLGWFQWISGKHGYPELEGTTKELYHYERTNVREQNQHFNLFNNWFDHAWTDGRISHLRTFETFTELSGEYAKAKKPLIIAHRGDTEKNTENTLDAVKQAIRQSDLVDYIEVDVSQCTDGFVIFHDEQIDGQNLVELTIEQCKELGKKEGIRIPQLKEVLRICEGRIGLILDIKEVRSLETLLQLVRRFYFPFPQIALTSFDPDILGEARRLAPELPCGLTFNDPNQDIVDMVKKESPKFVAIDYKILNAELVEKLKENGVAVFTWNVNSEDELSAAQKFGVNGLSANNLKLIRSLIQ